MRKWLFIFGLGVAVVLLLIVRRDSNNLLKNKSLNSVTPIKKEIVEKPKIFEIPKLKINTTVEYVGVNEDGRMDVPKDFFNVGWWELGVKPRELGSGVIAGHLDTPSGEPAIFYGLNDLDIGDEIIITDLNNKTYTFIVFDKQTYKDANFPLNKVFATSDGKYLNLITCWGSFNKEQRNYDERLVIFSKLEE